MRCEVTDEPVVVMKSRPMKPGNGVEEKTKTTRRPLAWGLARSKALRVCEGAKSMENLWKEMKQSRL